MARNLGDFLQLQMSLFLVVPTRKCTTGTGFLGSHWLGQRQREELLSPCQKKREERAFPGYCQHPR